MYSDKKSAINFFQSTSIPKQCENLSMLFLGFSREAAASTQALLKTFRIAPRCRLISNELQLRNSLAERSWDLLLLSDLSLSDLTFSEAAEIIHGLDKDIPMLLLCKTLPNEKKHIDLLEHGIGIACCNDDEKLIALYIYNTLVSLKQRQYWRLSETHLERLQNRVAVLTDHSELAICSISEDKILEANRSFIQLLLLDSNEDWKDIPIEKFIAPHLFNNFKNELNLISSGEKPNTTFDTYFIRADKSRIYVQVTLNNLSSDKSGTVQLDMIEITDVLVAPDLQTELNNILSTKDFYNELENQIINAKKGGNDGFLFHITINTAELYTQRLSDEGKKNLFNLIIDHFQKSTEDIEARTQLDSHNFAIIFKAPLIELATKTAQSICDHISNNTIEIEEENITLSCSIGIATINESTTRGNDVMSRAEAAAKNQIASSVNGFAISHIDHSKPLQENHTENLSFVLNSIKNGNLKLLYQPILPLLSDIQIANFEVFLRFINDDNEEISPTMFTTSLADENVLSQMDMWVLDECTIKLRSILDQGKDCNIFINVTGRTLKNKNLLPWFSKQILSMGLPANRFVFQISEVDALASQTQFNAFCLALHKLKCSICLKHYGITSESHHILRNTNVDYVKLDGSYIKELSNNTISPSQMSQLIAPLKERRVQIIAPMVEDPKLMSKVFRLGIHMAQGHYLQPPQADMSFTFFEKIQEG